MKITNSKLAALLFLSLSPALWAAEVTAGWMLPPREIVYPDATNAWIVPVTQGADAFEVELKDGAKGSVTFTNGAIRIEKTNASGFIRVIPKEIPNFLPKARRLRVSADVESFTQTPCRSEGFVRIGPKRKWGGIEYSYKSEGRILSGKTKLDQLICTPEGRPQIRAAHFFREKVPSVTNNLAVGLYVRGAPCVTTWRNWRVDDVREVEKNNARNRKGLHGRSFASDMVDETNLLARVAADFEHTAKVDSADGYAHVKIDGKAVLPIFFKGGDVARGHRFGGKRMHEEAHVSALVAHVMFGSTANTVGPWTTNGFDVAGAIEQVKKSMRTAPDAFYVLTFRLDAPIGWCDTRTNEIWRTKNGAIIYGNSGHVVGTAEKCNPKLKSWPWVSYHSRVWRNTVKDILTTFIAELKKEGLSKRVIGVHIAGYHDAQFATACPDWSAVAQEAFAASGEKDYTCFQKKAPMELQDDFARHIRKCFGKDIVVFRWCMSAFGPGYCSAHDIRDFADSKEIDIIVPQPSYSHRTPGYAIGVKLPFASLHACGKLLVHEHDLRTYASWPNSDTVVRDAGLSRAEDIDEWRVIDHRTAGQMIARRTGFWYYDMESGWYDCPEIAADMADIIRMAQPFYLEKPTVWHPTAAFVIDEEDLLALQHAEGTNEVAKADINAYVKAIAASGVPCDVWMKGDFEKSATGNPSNLYRYVIHYNRHTPKKKAAEINAEARAVGAYVPLNSDGVQVDMNGDFISVNCLVLGKYDFTLPFPAQVINLKSGLPEKVSGGILPLNLAAGETCWFRLIKE